MAGVIVMCPEQESARTMPPGVSALIINSIQIKRAVI